MSDWAFFDKAERTARKPHRCAECGGTIEAGEKYADCKGKADGDMAHYRLCLTCDLITTEANLAIYDEGFPIGRTREDLRESHGIENPEEWARNARTMRQVEQAARAVRAQAEKISAAVVAEILVERRRQVERESWSTEHDDSHDGGSLASAAASYAMHAARRLAGAAGFLRQPPSEWPVTWGRDWWKPKDPRRDLVRAAALIVAEIERLDREATDEAEAA